MNLRVMFPYVQVSFQGLPRDPSLEAAVHRWVARLESMGAEIRGAEVTIEPMGRRRTSVRASIGPSSGARPAAESSHIDAFVAVSEAFRALHRQLLARAAAASRRPTLALAG